MESTQHTTNRWQRGQSLVETALFLPILLIIIAGLVEISNLIVAQSRADTAARAGARFGANGGAPEGVRVATLNTITQTLEMDVEHWDVWVFEGRVNNSGTAFADGSWEWNHVYGIGQSNNYTDTDELAVQANVLADLRSEGDQNASDIQIVGVLISHDVESILGLDVFIRGFNAVRGFAVMEVGPVMASNELDGCNAFPLLVEYGQRSMTENEYNGIDEQEWDYPSMVPNTPEIPTFASFRNHVSDIPLSEAVEGSLYYFESINQGPANASLYELGGASTNFDWVAWNTVDEPDGFNNAQEEFEASLAWPGNGGSSDPALAYVDPVTFSRDGIHAWDPLYPDRYDWVSKTEFNINSGDIKPILRDHIDARRFMRFLVYDRDIPGGATVPADYNQYLEHGAYKVRGFVIARMVGFQLKGNTHWFILEVLRFDESCGNRAP